MSDVHGRKEMRASVLFQLSLKRGKFLLGTAYRKTYFSGFTLGRRQKKKALRKPIKDPELQGN